MENQANLPGQKPEQRIEKTLTSGKRKNTFIFACSGFSNTGKLTMQAASTLAFRRPDTYRTASAHKGFDSLEEAVSDGFRILVLDGCDDHCATKKLGEASIEGDIYITVTDLGIEKTVPSDLKPEYIEKIIRAIKES